MRGEDELIVKLANYGGAARAVEVEWGGSHPIASITSAQVLTAASPDAQNTLDQPDAVAPAALSPAPTISAGGNGLHLEMPPWSLVVVTATLSRGELGAIDN